MSALGAAASLGLGLAAGALPYPLINGFAFSYASVECKFATPGGLITVKGIKSVNYKAPREMAKLWGTSSEPYAKTYGKQDYEADVEFYLAEAVNLQRSLGPGWGDTFFDLNVTYTTPGSYLLISDVIQGCQLNSPEQSFTSGSPEGLTRKYKLDPLKIQYDGNSILGFPLFGLLGL